LSHDIIKAYGGEIKAENITTGEPGNQKQETVFVIFYRQIEIKIRKNNSPG